MHTKNTKRVALKLPIAVHVLLVFVQAIIKALTANLRIPNPTPTVAALTQAAADLASAETAAQARTKGAAAARDVAKQRLVVMLRQLAAYVQTLADADPENSAAIIESAGLSVAATRTHTAHVFGAKRGNVSGSAVVVAPAAGKRAAYLWEYSADGGKTWVELPGTMQAKTTATGLPVGTVQFRYRALTKAGQGDWSAPVSLQVL